MSSEQLTTERFVLDLKNATCTPNIPCDYNQESVDVSQEFIKNLGDVVFVVEVTYWDGNTFGVTPGHTEYFVCHTIKFAQELASNIREGFEDVASFMLRHSGHYSYMQCFDYFTSNRETKILAFQVIKR